MTPPTSTTLPFVRIDQGPPPPMGYNFCDPTQGNWGCGYTDGFRVPFLVVSEYTGTGSSGYVSGACGTGEQNNCPYYGPSSYPYEYLHDFGSILAYTEVNFGMPQIDPPSAQNPGYADSNAPDWGPNGQAPLSDFFNWPGPGRSFKYINTPQGQDRTCFQNHHGANCPLANGWVATDPDSY